jgi:hypothetical protein
MQVLFSRFGCRSHSALPIQEDLTMITTDRIKKLADFFLPLLLVFAGMTYNLNGQPGSTNEPVRYIGEGLIDPDVHEGGLRYAIGTESRQVIRVNRSFPEWTGQHWTYNHAPNIAYWNGRFHVHYLSNLSDEHIEPGQTLVATSADGRNWEDPRVVFPPYRAPEGIRLMEGTRGYYMHQRMGFYTAPNGRLLISGFYGQATHKYSFPFDELGLGRVVREVYKDGSYGPIYFIRYSSHSHFNETNTSYPFYTRSDDKGFIEACEALLSDKLITMQWWDEDRGVDGFYSITEAGSAFNFYRRKDGKIVGLWKRAVSALSDDGIHFSKPVRSPTFIMSGGKMWGQATKDGRFAIVYNPIDMSSYRYPLIVVTSDDGIIFNDMVLVNGEVPPRRFTGLWKDFGPQYKRGIIEGNGNPPGDDMWLTYSMNKEDIWVSRIPVPVRYRVEGDVNDNFNNLEEGGAVTDWNIYAPKWAPVEVVAFPSVKNKSLLLQDRDPYDYARAIRVFEETEKAEISVTIHPKQSDNGILEIDITDGSGNRPVRIIFDEDGKIKALNGENLVVLQSYNPGKWYDIKIAVDASQSGSYNVSIDGRNVAEKMKLAEPVRSVERVSFRTGQYRDLPNRTTPNQPEASYHPPLPEADYPVPVSEFYINDFRAVSKR